jgi:predicted ATPase/class 3 adenylate cyclase
VKRLAVFCFTDIEGSTKKWEEHRDVMARIIERHNAILQEKVEAFGGKIIKFTGDGMFAVFHEPATTGAPLQCAIEIQKAMQSERWPVIGELRIRMALHTGEAQRIADDYFGPVANRTARLMALGWGGQILISDALKQISVLPAGAYLEDLGVHQVKDLPEPQQVYGLCHPDLTLHEFPAPKSLSSHPNNLPVQLSPFIGRRQELSAIAELLTESEYRLFSLLGPGGIGKTRLAIQAAFENLARFRHGAFFVDLAPISDPDQIAHRIGDAIKLRFYEREDPKIQLLSYLRERELLLVLDNFEHLTAGAPLVAEILQAAPKLKVIVTSREILHLGAECVVGVTGLTYPESEDPSVDPHAHSAIEFFVSHAKRVRPDFQLSPDSIPWLIKLCRMVSGMPLGLGLAAAWTRLLSVKAIAQRVETDIAFIAGSERDLPERHRSIRAVFDYSWNLLGEQEKEVLRRLSVFRGSFDLDAAQVVTGGSFEVLTNLVDKSLLLAVPGPRYALHEAVRQFAGEQLKSAGDEQVALDRHCSYFCEFLAAKERSVMGYQQARGFAEIREELENARSAFLRAVAAKKVPEIAKSAACLGIYLVMQGMGRQQADTIDKALELWRPGSDIESDTPDSLKAQASLLLRQAFFFHSAGRAGVGPPSEKALALFRRLGDEQSLADCLVLMAVFDLGQSALDRIRYLREAVTLYQKVGDRNGLAWATANLAAAQYALGRNAESLRGFTESLAVFREVGNRREEAWTLVGLSRLARDAGRLQEAHANVGEASAIFNQLGDVNAVVICLGIMKQDAVRRKDWTAARNAAREALVMYRDLGYAEGVAESLQSLAEIDAASHDVTG